ncbi:TPA: DUF1566 domain-containing protein [Candidatus Nomurabacteria bacterium]|nr:MAG: hypothetical protein O210_OD1C00001G0025 [Parcubacteria bacterium RAAC4_OD1_1]HCY26541.1 DUF1566 domain-containing protein [Candidatus Nomurabacteria bacterium]
MKKLLKTIPYIIIAVLVGVTVAYAGTLTPPGAPAKSMKSLSDLYELVNTGANTPSTDFTTPSTVASTMTSIGDVYDTLKTKITDIDSTKILTGTTIFGKAGSASAGGVNLVNMFNGTCGNGAGACPSGEFTGGTQALGGVDDANSGPDIPLTPPTDRYETTWTACNVGNSYCGTEDTGANMKDEATGLVWSYPLKGLGGATFDTVAPTPDPYCLSATYDALSCYWDTDTYYSWDASRVDNDSKTAQQLCSDHTGWSLPHQKQLMQAYIDGGYGNLDPVGVDRNYWSATTHSYYANYAWGINLPYGYTDTYTKFNNNNVRCVRE